MKPGILSLTALVLAALFSTVYGEENSEPTSHAVSDNKVSLRQAGAVIALQNCLMCHSLRYVKYSHLEQLEFSENELATLRFGRSPDQSLLRYMDDKAVRTLYGLLPPDLSLMVKAQRGGPDYIYSLLTSYHRQTDGSFDNHFVPGIRMPDVLSASLATDRSKIEMQARQVVAFLFWASDPHVDERHALGYGVISYLVVLTLLLYLVKRRVWRRLQ